MNIKSDPIKRQVTVSAADMGQELSPMSPPEGREPPSDCKVAYEELHPFLQQLIDDHDEFISELHKIKSCVEEIKESRSLSKSSFEIMSKFLDYMADDFVEHNKREERVLFPILNKKLLDNNEHSPGPNPFTGIKVLEDDHLQATSFVAVLSNLLLLSSKISHESSHAVLVNQIYKNAEELLELLDLHIFREDNIIFGQAQNMLTAKEWTLVEQGFLAN